MKKNSTFKSLALRLCLMIGALFASSSAFAGYFDGTAEDLILDQEYVLTNLSSVTFHKYYYFTPEEDGLLKIDCSVGNFTSYFDDTFDRDEEELGDHAYGPDDGGFTNDANGIQHCSYMNVEEGKTYYLGYSSSASNEATFTAHLYNSDDKPELLFLSPTEGSVLEINDFTVYGNITLSFTRSVEMGTITLGVGDGTVQQRGMSRSMQNGLYVINVRDILYTWLSEGYAQKGDDVWITIEDIYAVGDETCIYGDDGTLELHWILPKAPIGLQSATWPETFLSWWDEGDERALATLVFDDDLATYDKQPYQSAFVYIDFGNREGEDENSFYEETLSTDKITIDGNVMIIDFSGKNRTRSIMTPGVDSSDITQIALSVHTVIDADGDYTYSTSSGSVGSYSSNYIPYVDLSTDEDPDNREPSKVIVTTPANGGTVGDFNSITLYCEAGLTTTWYSDPDEGIQLTEESIIVYDGEGDEVAHGVKDGYEEIGTTGYIFYLSEDLTTLGQYTLTIPENFFYIGSGADTYSEAINIVINVDPSLDGISKVETNADTDGKYYNLAGQQVATPSKGIYITNGKKVVVK